MGSIGSGAVVWIAALITTAMLTGCKTMGGATGATAELMVPQTVNPTSPVQILAVDSASPLQNSLKPGDRVIQVGSTTISTFGELMQIPSIDPDDEVTISTGDGRLVKVSIQSFLQTNKFPEILVMEPGTVMYTKDFVNVDGQSQKGGISGNDDFAVVASLTRFRSTPEVLEVALAAQSGNGCKNCGLKAVRLLDVSKQSWLSPVAVDAVAWIVYPDLGQTGQMVNVPPPVPVGGTAYSRTQGNVSVYSLGNTAWGDYQSNTYTNYQQHYDYSATNTANMVNMMTTIRNNQIHQQNQNRATFATKRFGNLRQGTLAPGEMVTGHLFFAAPAGFNGPYMLFVDGENGNFIMVKFVDILDGQ